MTVTFTSTWRRKKQSELSENEKKKERKKKEIAYLVKHAVNIRPLLKIENNFHFFKCSSGSKAHLETIGLFTRGNSQFCVLVRFASEPNKLSMRELLFWN